LGLVDLLLKAVDKAFAGLPALLVEIVFVEFAEVDSS